MHVKKPSEQKNQLVSHDILESTYEFSIGEDVWVADIKQAFRPGKILEINDSLIRILFKDDDTVATIKKQDVFKMNPEKFEKVNDMAELTYLNEASVIYNLSARFMNDLIYTYSGLFLVAVNPYQPLPIYTEEVSKSYRNSIPKNTNPHIFAIADKAYKNMLSNQKDQSILVTGESGAGKTENTKRVIQYLAVRAGKSEATFSNTGLEERIVQANPILESFGNARTTRNNNSSRFGKFIRIEFSDSGKVVGAFIDWYLLEKSRVVIQASSERNYHIFYQILKGADPTLKKKLFLDDTSVSDYSFIKNTNELETDEALDSKEYSVLINAFRVMNFTETEQFNIFKIIAVILLLGNIEISENRSNQARISTPDPVEKACQLLSISSSELIESLLTPKVKAGKSWVVQKRTAMQVRFDIESLAKTIYERLFGYIVSRINKSLESENLATHSIGVLDIAGFEIFKCNSFEQLCINYTNEKLQQFFNHHMFVLEQQEYSREGIKWNFKDFGLDLQQAIDIIEKSNPIGIFSCLDEECVMPNATDDSFTDKLHSLWDDKVSHYKKCRFNKGFKLTHYASEVEYSTEGWLDKNKDPLNDNITSLLRSSSDNFIGSMFKDPSARISKVKKGLFRTVAQRHKEQLSDLMEQLENTHPHFVRCIIPNHKKSPKSFMNTLVLDQLRCNGVLEGIRIVRTGYPNRIKFKEFNKRYAILYNEKLSNSLDENDKSKIILREIQLSSKSYQIGLTKIFFRTGILAHLEELREQKVNQLIKNIQCTSRGFLARAYVQHLVAKKKAAQVLKRNLSAYLSLMSNPWFELYGKLAPLLVDSDAYIQKVSDSAYKDLEKNYTIIKEQTQFLKEEKRKLESIYKINSIELKSVKQLADARLEELDELKIKNKELENKLAQIQKELKALQIKCKDLTKSEENVSVHADALRQEIEKGVHVIGKLEGQKNELNSRISKLESEIIEHQAKQKEYTKTRSSLEEEIKFLKGCLAMKEKKIKELEEKLKDSDNEIKKKLEASIYEKSNQKVKELMQDNNKIRNNLNELTKSTADYEKLVRRKEAELNILRAELESQDKKLKDYDKEMSTLKSKNQSIVLDLQQAQNEILDLKNSNISSRNQLDSSNQAFLDKQNETDIQEIQASFEGERKAWKEERRLKNAEISRLQKEISKFKANKENKYQGNISNLSVGNHDMQPRLVRSPRYIISDIDKSNKGLSDLNSLRDNSAGSFKILSESDSLSRRSSYKSNHENSSTSAESRINWYENELNKANEEISMLKTQINNSETARKRLSSNLDVLNTSGLSRMLNNTPGSKRRSKIHNNYGFADEIVLDDYTEKLQMKIDNLQELLEYERSKSTELEDTLNTYKSRSKDYLGKLESMEVVFEQASQSEKVIQKQFEELKRSYKAASDDLKQSELSGALLLKQNNTMNEKLLNYESEINSLQSNVSKLKKENLLLNLNIKSNSTELNEQVRKAREAFDSELKKLNRQFTEEQSQTDVLRKTCRNLKDENNNLQESLDELKKEKLVLKNEGANMLNRIKRLDSMLETSEESRRQAEENANTMLGQIKALGATIDDIAKDRDELQKEKRILERRLAGLSTDIGKLALSPQKTSRSLDMEKEKERELYTVKEKLTKQLIHSEALQKQLNDAEGALLRAKKEVLAERTSYDSTYKLKCQLEKECKGLKAKLIEYENGSLPLSRLDGNIQQEVSILKSQLSEQASQSKQTAFELAAAERSIKDLKAQLSSKDRINSKLQEEIAKSEDRLEELNNSLLGLRKSESSLRLSIRRAERDELESRERALRLEKEMENFRYQYEKGY